MWGPDDFPTGNVPWWLLIRARYVHEIDAVLASSILRQVGAVASTEVTRALAVAAAEGTKQQFAQKADSGQRLAAFEAVAELEEICGNVPRSFPPRPHHGFEDLSDPVAGLVIEKAYQLVQTAGSEQLKQTFGKALADTGAIVRDVEFSR